MIRSIFVCFILLSCSSSEKKNSESAAFITPDHVAKEEKSLIDFGPTQKIRKNFLELSEEYGLSSQEAVNLYAVDWSGDGLTDLVILPDFFSMPIFYKYSKKEKKFILTEGLIKEYPRGSFLAFAESNKDGYLDFIEISKCKK